MAVKTINSVTNALSVLEVLAGNQPVGVSALARLTELDKAAVQRILLTLRAAGWLHQLETGEWAITSKALQIGTHFTSGLRELAHPHLVQLQRDTDETVLLFAREDNTMVVLDSVDSSQVLRMTVPIGMVVPLRQSAAFDAWLPDIERSELPVAGPAPSANAVAAVRRQGFFVIDEMYPNAMAAGAPIMDRLGRPVATITVVGPNARITRAAARAQGERAAEAAARVTNASGRHA